MPMMSTDLIAEVLYPMLAASLGMTTVALVPLACLAVRQDSRVLFVMRSGIASGCAFLAFYVGWWIVWRIDGQPDWMLAHPALVADVVAMIAAFTAVGACAAAQTRMGWLTVPLVVCGVGVVFWAT